MTHWGELAAIGTVICWTFTSLFFEAAGHRIGSLSVNWIRLVMAICFFVPVCVWQFGHPFPIFVGLNIWWWLGLSAVVGFLIGDLALFRAFVLIGPRLSMTMMALAPPMAALTAWLVLAETFTPRQSLGMLITLVGVILVVLDRDRKHPKALEGAAVAKGIGLAFLGAAGQAVGLVLSKRGMLEGGGIDPLRATFIRVIVGAIGFMVLFTIIGWWPRVRAALKHPAGLGFTAGGAFCGPFLGVSLSLVAVRLTSTGVAATIMALTPVTLIPAVMFLRKERVGWKGYLGSAQAVAGIAFMI